MASTPIMAQKKPRKPPIQPFRGVLSTLRLPQMVIPKIASRKSSHLPNFSAMLEIKGVASIMIMQETMVPRQEASTPPNRALPPLPCIARG